ncbi:hypothetical protein LJR220_003113 [Bradyrhizobium sp. LjRoot220]|uniref:hypothetical protein n=1 Tax=Bradyrhizobium sp. LjRoot220 TaxID=3342284 RepID=UPI003ECD5F76
MDGAAVRRWVRPKRLIARRPRPDLEFFFSRYERRGPAVNRRTGGSRYDLYGLEGRARFPDRR